MFNPSRAETSSVRSTPNFETLRVLSVPPRHPYIRAIASASVGAVATDRTLDWEPDPIFEPGAISARAGAVDVVHVHFSFDHLDVTSTRAWLTELKARGLPLVLTVHDLRNPHHLARTGHDQLLAELIPAAAAVITLTKGAAIEIADRFGVEAQVLPHPSMVDPSRSVGTTTEWGLVTMNLGFLRRNVIEPLALVQAAAKGATDAGGRLRVDLEPRALRNPSLVGLNRIAGIEVNVHARFSDLELEHYVRRGHVAVLPYRWGTHSGWLEMARDLGTRIVAPDCGYYDEQWSDVVPYGNNETDGFDAASLRKAVAYALNHAPPLPANHAARLAEAAAVRQTHEALYRRLAG